MLTGFINKLIENEMDEEANIKFIDYEVTVNEYLKLAIIDMTEIFFINQIDIDIDEQQKKQVKLSNELRQ